MLNPFLPEKESFTVVTGMQYWNAKESWNWTELPAKIFSQNFIELASESLNRKFSAIPLKSLDTGRVSKITFPWSFWNWQLYGKTSSSSAVSENPLWYSESATQKSHISIRFSIIKNQMDFAYFWQTLGPKVGVYRISDGRCVTKW